MGTSAVVYCSFINANQTFMKTSNVIFSVVLLFIFIGCIDAQQHLNKNNPYYSHTDNSKLTVSDAEWKKVLTPEQYHILREEGTERPDTGPYVHNPKNGIYYCAACGHPLFNSSSKFNSGTGWPSFFQPLNKNSVTEKRDNSAGMARTEIVCARCGGHLGHVFDDGPQPTGLRYCMNGYALAFEEKK